MSARSARSSRVNLPTAAARKGVSLNTIRRRVNDGSLPAFWDGNRQVVEITDLDIAFELRRVVPKSGNADLDDLVKETVAAWPRMTSAQRNLVISLGGAS